MPAIGTSGALKPPSYSDSYACRCSSSSFRIQAWRDRICCEVRICGEYDTSALQWPTRSMKRRSTFIMTEKHSSLRSLNRFKTLGSSNVTRDRHMNLTNKRKPTERHCTVLRTPFVCRPCIPAPPCVLNGTVRCVCPSALVVLNCSAFRLPN